MKKMKKLLAGLSAIAMLTSISAIPAFAAEQETYELNNEAYIESIKKLGNNLIYEDEFLKRLTERKAPVNGEYVHAYFSPYSTEIPSAFRIYLESKGTTPEISNRRFLEHRLVLFNEMESEDINFWNEHTNEELNSFLAENGFTAYFGVLEELVEQVDPTENWINRKEHYLFFEENASEEEIFETFFALNDKYNLYPGMYGQINDEIIPPTYIDNQKTAFFQRVEFESPTVTVNAPSISGDLDNDSAPGLTDVVKLTKYNANPELYPLADPTALANADVNKDGTIDAIDTNILIEMVLGSYESAV